jgi:hypothetical protein
MLIEQLNTNNEGELGAPASGDDEEGCDAGDCCSRSTALVRLLSLLSPLCPPVLSSFDFSVSEMNELRK